MILASIAAVGIPGYIARGKRTKAIAELKNIDTALATMLADSGKSSFRHFFYPDALRQLDLAVFEALQDLLHVRFRGAPYI